MVASHRLSFLQHQIDLVAVPVFVADQCDDGRFRFVAINTAFARLSGRTKEALVGLDPTEMCADPTLIGLIKDKYRQCLAGGEPVSFRDRFLNKDTVVLVDTTLQRIELPRTGRHRVVGTALEVGDQQAMTGDVGFYLSLARNSLTTIEMLMKAGQERHALSISEREATDILTRKALLALEDAERAVARLVQSDRPRETGMAEAVRSLLLH